MRIAITGSSGLVGRALCLALESRGHNVVRVVRSPQGRSLGVDEWLWDPDTGLSPESLAQLQLKPADAWVFLHGAGIAEGRWTPQRKALLRSSRVDATAKLVAQLGMQRNRGPLEVETVRVVAASAIGIYGTGPEPCAENSPVAHDFLGQLALDWESVWFAARSWARVVHPRLGVVLSPEGGALAKMLPAFKLGLGGPLGAGTQMLSWISLPALVDLLVELTEGESELGQRCGPVNAVQGAVAQRDFARILGRVLGRPAFLPTPSLILELALGEMARELLLRGRPVYSQFYHPHPEGLSPEAFLEQELRRVLFP
jgi:uncharacterized protein (TIGR01777 family)